MGPSPPGTKLRAALLHRAPRWEQGKGIVVKVVYTTSILARVGLSRLARVRSIHDIVIVKEE
jgi:hypothetical protein